MREPMMNFPWLGPIDVKINTISAAHNEYHASIRIVTEISLTSITPSVVFFSVIATGFMIVLPM